MYRILYIDHTKGLLGGGQISLIELLRRIDRSRFDIYVIVSEEGRLSQQIKKLNIIYRIIPLPTLKSLNPFIFLNAINKLLKFIRLHRIDLIHANTSRAGLYASMVNKVLNIPLIWHVRIPYVDILLDRFIAYHCKKIIVVSKSVAKRFAWLNKDRLALIYNGVDVNRFSPGKDDFNLRNYFGIKPSQKVIGTLGRFSPRKGYETLIYAIKEVIKGFPEVKFLWVGEGDINLKMKFIDKIKKLGITEHFILTGFYEEVWHLLKIMDIFCLPSLSEGFSRSILEAMSTGLPVVATRVGGNLEIIEHKVDGLLVPPEDPQALACALIELLSNEEEAKKMGLAGRQKVVERFSIEKNVTLTERLYEEVLLKDYEGRY
ncbi:MAG: glycosyltransferase family 4 protein [Candidatus Omnitrophica bacterium]|nr:glycosyltransferase family 4 protein [Candidatus Omnitrophota bacterium]